jgi:hypothetical protein
MPQIGESDHFVFFGVERNPLPGRRLSTELSHVTHGPRELNLWKSYARTLEEAYRQFVQAGRPRPRFRYSLDEDPRKNRIPVFLLAADHGSRDCSFPFARGGIFPSGQWAPFMGLPVRRSDPSREAERGYFDAVAVHELSHVFGMWILPHRRMGDANENPDSEIATWIWLDEGIATASETKVLPASNDWLRYAMPWLDHPELSLTDGSAWYQAAFFVRYVEARVFAKTRKSDFSFRVWEQAASVWKSVDGGGTPRALSALDALALSLAKHKIQFCSSNPEIGDFFASGYCMDSYFLWDPASPGFEPLVHERYPGGRGIAKSWDVRNRGCFPDGGHRLPHLACRYFRIFPTDSPAQITVSVAVSESDGCELKAELACALPKTKNRGWRRRFVKTPSKSGYRLDIEHVAPLSREDCDHLVLVVVNCALNSGGHTTPTTLTFSVSISWESMLP